MWFGNVGALTGVDLSVGRNEIVGLVGDNGAGKSTLIKIITGVLRPTAGSLYIRDEEVDLRGYSVLRAHQLGIETVHQERSLCEKQPLWRNFFVGRQITNRFGFINVRKQKELAQEILLKSIGFRGAGITVDTTSKTSRAARGRESPSAGPCTSTPTSSFSTSRRRRSA